MSTPIESKEFSYILEILDTIINIDILLFIPIVSDIETKDQVNNS